MTLVETTAAGSVGDEAEGRAAPAAREPNGGDARAEPPPSRKEALVSRLWRIAESQVERVESRGRTLPGAGGLEQDAKTLAVLCRVIKELPPEEDEAARARARARAEAEAEAHDDADERDVDAFREEIARHLARIAEERAAAAGGEPPLAEGAGELA